MEILRVNNVRKTYHQGTIEINALNGISFRVEKNEFVAIMGPSGGGKSTLLHMIGGVDNPTSGQVYIDNVEINALKEENRTIFRRRQIGLIYQFYNLLPNLNVEENIKIPILLDNKKVDEHYFQELAKTLGLLDRLKHRPNELSGGQQQRVSIARALMNQPSLILADEPTGNLDQVNSAEIMELFKLSHRKYNQTILLITHDESIARQADRLIYICDGKIIKDEGLR